MVWSSILFNFKKLLLPLSPIWIPCRSGKKEDSGISEKDMMRRDPMYEDAVCTFDVDHVPQFPVPRGTHPLAWDCSFKVSPTTSLQSKYLAYLLALPLLIWQHAIDNIKWMNDPNFLSRVVPGTCVRSWKMECEASFDMIWGVYSLQNLLIARRDLKMQDDRKRTMTLLEPSAPSSVRSTVPSCNQQWVLELC